MLFDLTALKPLDQYKLLASTVVPRPIAWVVTLDAEGRLNAAPFSFFNVFGSGPPILCIGIGARRPGDCKDTGENIRLTGEFVVNLVAHDNAEAMNVTAIEFGPEIDELAEAKLTTLPSAKIKPPRIAESPVAMECVRHSMIEFGPDRALVVGRVVAMHVRDDAVLDAERCHIDTPKLDLIGRMHGAGWYSRTTERFDMPRILVDEWHSVE
ncbi:flavin reductase family protein [Acidiphilium sp. AL]|uniref:Flavin reductase family protein n=1 Tax=Acidiphilium iwatense TaxID=768198 RepID=A0ABS9DZI7_9PROT|nr:MULTISPECIES: flavin reductase family protein [Acidiphilium]MCF3946842.1 flavin reductase family protein [Acidiphilium iwatense]MCU4161026.1 flavin reductase family protein [Acidiphilium sp. AL]